jgi:hypothetical protein
MILKKNKALIVFNLLFTFYCSAQDTIQLKSNAKVIANVREIDADFITYSLAEQDSVYLLISKSDVQSIHYLNGSVEEFLFPSNNSFGVDAYQRGFSDAAVHYNGGPAFTKGIIDGLLTYIMYAGVVLVIIDYRKAPKISYPYGIGFEDEPSKDPEYRKGFEDRASKIKKKKLVGGYFTGLVSFPIILAGVLLGTLASEM